MPEHIRALVAILIVSSAVFFLARPIFSQIISLQTFDRWRRLWFFTTLAWFLANSFWIYVGLLAAALTIARKKETNILGLYFLLLFAAPAIQTPIPGFGLIDHLFMLDHYRLLALLLLLPTALALASSSNTPKFGSSPVDWLIVGYLSYIWVLYLSEASFTNAMRMAFLYFIDGFLPYYVLSRGVRNNNDFQGVLSGVLLGALLISMLALFEVVRNWRLYSASISELGINYTPQGYKMRGPFLRPGASLLDSIVLGLVVVIAMGVLLYLKNTLVKKTQIAILWFLLMVGLLASLARAPWVAAVLLFFVYVIQGDRVVGLLLKMIGAFSALMIALSIFPAGRVIIDLLPFFGKSEQGSIEYRENWFSVAAPLIERNFWFGDLRVLEAPEIQVMRQGEGIIDLVNMFLSVLLFYGAFGLLLFLGMFGAAIWYVKKSIGKCSVDMLESKLLGRVLISVMISIMFVIFTLSAISIVPIVIWTFLGLCSAYGLVVGWHVRGMSKLNPPRAL